MKSLQLVRPGPISLGIEVILGATVFYWFAALLTKWSGSWARSRRVGAALRCSPSGCSPRCSPSPSDGRGALAGRGVRGRRRGDRASRLPDRRRGVEPRASGVDTPATSWSGEPWPPRSRSPSSPEAPGASSAPSWLLAGRQGGAAQAGLWCGPGPPRCMGGFTEEVSQGRAIPDNEHLPLSEVHSTRTRPCTAVVVCSRGGIS